MSDQSSIYAGFWIRFWAMVIDTLLLMVILLPLSYLLYGEDFLFETQAFTPLNIFIHYALPMGALLLFWHYKSATPAKMLFSLSIVNASNHGKPTTRQYILRNIGYILSLIPLGLGYFWVVWDPKKQAWHDKLAKTVVIKEGKISHSSRTRGSWIVLGFGVVAMGLFILLLVVGLMLEQGRLAQGTLYSKSTLPAHVEQSFRKEGLLQPQEKLLYFQSEKMLYFLERGTIFSDEAITHFRKKERGGYEIVSIAYRTMEDLTLQRESLLLGVELLSLKVYARGRGLVMVVGVLPMPNSYASRSFWEDIQRLMGERKGG
jgi:uncharacterized RDD family membrane protein YckC